LSKDFVIRKARVADAPAIQELIRLGTQSGKILRRTPQDVRRNVRFFWLVEEGEKVIACCSLEVYNRKLAEVRSLSVLPGSRGRGVASALIAHCLREARRRRIYEVLAITDRQRLFKRQGFSEQLHGQKALFSRPNHH
jgi:amino-acid N-acetyltransferase